VRRNALVLRWLVFLVTSAVLVCLSFAQEEGFGRFGYRRSADLFGFQITPKGVKANHPDADRLQFVKELNQWNTVQISNWHQVVVCEGGAGLPSKIRFDLFDYGFSAYFPAGVKLKTTSTGNPLLSWTEGSVGKEVPTPASDWISLSFQDRQPPIVFGFPDSKAELTVTGTPGNWTISSDRRFKGWVRFSLPFGLEPVQTTTASALGRLTKRCKDYEDVWYSPVGDSTTPEIEEDAQGLNVTWNFPRKHAVIPVSLYLAVLGGYPVQISSQFRTFPSPLGNEPLIFTEEPVLKARLPVVRVPVGRGLSIGEFTNPLVSNYSWERPLEIVSLALSNTLSARPQVQTSFGKQLQQVFYDKQPIHREPNSKLSVFFDAAGKGTLETAIHGLLSQSLRASDSADVIEDPQLKSLFWRLDPYSGLINVKGDDERRVKAIAGIGTALCGSIESRFQSAFFQAGLAAERGLYRWQQLSVKKPQPKMFLEPMLSLRKGIFNLTLASDRDPILTNWLSEIRVLSELSIWAQQTEGGLELAWMPKDRLISTFGLESSYGLGFSSIKNLKSLFHTTQIGYFEVRFEPERMDKCTANLYVPDWVDALPKIALSAKYSEPNL
jgi:hypothetical protein